MKIYIPNHLKRLKIVDQMCKMIEEYSKTYYTTYIDPYTYYYSLLNNDPVKKFIGICLLGNKFRGDLSEEEEIELNNIVNYLTCLFYSVKGCNEKILDLLKIHLGLNIINYSFIESYQDNIFTGNKNKYYDLYIELSDIPNLDRTGEEFFINVFRDFLNNLLLLNNVSITIASQNLIIDETINYEVQTEIRVYNSDEYEYKEETILF